MKTTLLFLLLFLCTALTPEPVCGKITGINVKHSATHSTYATCYDVEVNCGVIMIFDGESWINLFEYGEWESYEIIYDEDG